MSLLGTISWYHVSKDQALLIPLAGSHGSNRKTVLSNHNDCWLRQNDLHIAGIFFLNRLQNLVPSIRDQLIVLQPLLLIFIFEFSSIASMAHPKLWTFSSHFLVAPLFAEMVFVFCPWIFYYYNRDYIWCVYWRREHLLYLLLYIKLDYNLPIRK